MTYISMRVQHLVPFEEGGRSFPDARLRPTLSPHCASCALQMGKGVCSVFQGGHLKHLLTRAKLAALGLPCPSSDRLAAFNGFRLG